MRATYLAAGVVAGAGAGLVGAVADPVLAAVTGGVIGGGAAAVAHGRSRNRLHDLRAERNELRAVVERQQALLDDQPNWQQDLVQSLVQAALLFDDTGYLVAWNAPARSLLGLSDRPMMTVVKALGSTALVDAVSRARQDGGHVEAEADIGDRHVRASVATVGTQTLVILTDRTQERRIEELRRNFVVNASHELKTPATAIHTLTEALEITAERDPGRVPDLVVRLREEAERLVRLVHDLLNLRRLEERADVEAVPMDLVELARDVLVELGDRAAERSIDLALSAPERAELSGEPDDVRLVVRNLVANAVQYNRDGGRVDVRIAASTSEQGPAWTLDVSDTGIGIPQQDLQRIFERFYRVDVARSRETGGTGLGLSIVRHAVERHHGTIRVDSLLGEGTTFSVSLPAVPPRDH